MSRLSQFAEKLNNEIECMKDREKGDINAMLGQIITINDYDWLNDTTGNGTTFPVFTIAEDEKHYFFGGKALHDGLKAIDEAKLKEDLQKEGLKVKLEKIKTKNKNDFTKVTYCPLPF